MTETLHFTIQGETTTQLVRNLWEDENIEGAFRATREGLNMPDRLAIDLMAGKRKLVGDTKDSPDLDLVEDTTKGITFKEMRNKLEDKYTNYRLACIFDKKSVYSIYEDEKMSLTLNQLMFLYTVGAMDSSIVFNKLQRKVDEIKEKNSLIEYAPDNKPTEAEFLEESKEVKRPPLKQVKLPKMAQSGWLLPSGKFHTCDYSQHVNLLSKLHGDGTIDFESEAVAEKKKWIKISARNIFIRGHFKLTQKQQDMIFDFMLFWKLEKIEVNSMPRTMKQIMDSNY